MDYYKLFCDLRTARITAQVAGSQVKDDGSCNLDHCMLLLKGSNENEVYQWAEKAGVRTSKREDGWYFVGGYCEGQANKRTTMVEAFTKKLEEHWLARC